MKQITEDDVELIKFYISQRRMIKALDIINKLEDIKEIKIIENEKLPAN